MIVRGSNLLSISMMALRLDIVIVLYPRTLKHYLI